ncbi:Eco57I restriction-modification methylase domain-containing protein [Pleurocapsales cyanobacterium LEGE 10410]|nr:Eco57I restriction-modification methylase domain-containing protein [Pleurocapsales cyanobacterium LEGE 10410]
MLSLSEKINYNPDVLSCLANLSNDEVFTPPRLVNDMLDMLPEELWRDKNATFLDPVNKSGVFLREIAKRLTKGLEEEFPDQQERVNHIFKNQLFGIAITELTSMLSRRSVYCSKYANGKYSVCTEFDTEEGNILYDRIEHTWKNGKCTYCGASKSEYDRDESLETHAYQFIHTENHEELFDMRFDVIVGNPPYQLSDGGAQKSASPIYHKFVEQAKKLNPRYLSMIIPARWYNGGKGLNEFRNNMLSDNRISELHDFPDTSDCFPGQNIRGGVCYFLWEKEFEGDCKVITHRGDVIGEPVTRPLIEKGLDIFIRYNESISILRKVQGFEEKTFNELVSPRKPFGFATNFKKFKKERSSRYKIELYRNGKSGYVSREQIEKNLDAINKWKIYVPYASPGDDTYPHLILSTPLIGKPLTVCTETYLMVGPFENETEAKNVKTYMKTVFLRFMILLAKSTQHITQKRYSFVPIQNFSKAWTDEDLIKKYKITQEEWNFMTSLVRIME